MGFQVKIDERIPVTAMEGIERVHRLRGINVIHGGTNALRFTPNFDITKAEADMQIEHVRASRCYLPVWYVCVFFELYWHSVHLCTKLPLLLDGLHQEATLNGEMLFLLRGSPSHQPFDI